MSIVFGRLTDRGKSRSDDLVILLYRMKHERICEEDRYPILNKENTSVDFGRLAEQTAAAVEIEGTQPTAARAPPSERAAL